MVGRASQKVGSNSQFGGSLTPQTICPRREKEKPGPLLGGTGQKGFTMKQLPETDQSCNIVYLLHRGRSRRALVRVVADRCGLYRVEWLDIGLSDLTNLSRAKAAACEWAERNAVLEDRKSNAARRLKSLDNFWWSSSYVAQNIRGAA